MFEKIGMHNQLLQSTDKKYWLLAEKAYHLIQQHRMKDIGKDELKKELALLGEVNLYLFIKKYLP